MPVPTRVARALDIHPIVVGVRTALLANTAITALVTDRIYIDDNVSGGIFPYLTISVPSDLTANTYSHSGVNDLFQITAVDKPSGPLAPTGNVAALGAAIQTALLDTAWTITGWTLIAVTREGTRPYTDSAGGTGNIYRYNAVTVRIQAIKT